MLSYEGRISIALKLPSHVEIRAARAFVINQQGKLLAVRRALDDPFNAGKWECPGGKPKGSQTLLEAIQDELMEEVGLEVLDIHPGIIFSQRRRTRENDGDYIMNMVIVRDFLGNVRLSHEHTESKWLRLKSFLNLDLTRESRVAAFALRKHLQ